MKYTLNPEKMQIKLPSIKVPNNKKAKSNNNQQMDISSSMYMLKSIKVTQPSYKRKNNVENTICSLQKMLTCQKSNSSSKLFTESSQYKSRKKNVSMNMNANFVAMCQRQMRQYERIKQKDLNKKHSIRLYPKKEFFVIDKQSKRSKETINQLENNSIINNNKQLQTIEYQITNQSFCTLNKKKYSQLSLQEFINNEIPKKIRFQGIFYNERKRKQTSSQMKLDNSLSLKGWTSSKDFDNINLQVL